MRETVFSEPSKLMNNKVLNIATVVVSLAAMVFLPFNKAITLGVILGALSFRGYYALLTYHYEQMLSGMSLTIWAKMIRYLLLMFPMLLGVLWPEVINVWGVLSGVLLLKAVMIIDAARQ